MAYSFYDLHVLFLDEIKRAGLVLNSDALFVASLDDRVLMPIVSVGLQRIDTTTPLEERPPEARLTLVAVAPRDVSLHILYRCFVARVLRGDYRSRLSDVDSYFGQCLSAPHDDRHTFSALTVRAELAASTDSEEPEWYVSLWPLRIGVYAHLGRLSLDGEVDDMTMASLRGRAPAVMKHIRAQLATLAGAIPAWRAGIKS